MPIVLAALNAKWIHPSLALRLLKANLGDWESGAVILEFALRQPLEEKLAAILKARPRILALSVSIWNHLATLELLDALDAAWPQAEERPWIVLGGPEASRLSPEAPLLSRADLVIRGEGEDAFREAAAQLLCRDREKTPPRKSPKIEKAPPVDLAKIHRGYRLYTEEDLARKMVYVESSRGCPYCCAFCQSAGEPVRNFPLEPFLADLEALLLRGGRAFKFLDRTFNGDIDRAARILQFFLDRLERFSWVHFEMVPGRFPPALRKILCRFPPGKLRLEIGFQTFNAETAALIRRPFSPEGDLEALTFLTGKTAAIVHADLIAGLPGEGFCSFAAGFDRLWQAGPAEIQPGILKGLPGAPITGFPGLRFAQLPPYEVVETAVLRPAELDRLKNFARFWEILMNRRPFPAILAAFPRNRPVFAPFLALADRLLARFGRNWGIDRRTLESACVEALKV